MEQAVAELGRDGAGEVWTLPSLRGDGGEGADAP
jgi:hypothetical protein